METWKLFFECTYSFGTNIVFVSGSLKYVHQSCLQQWLTASETRSCELCKFNFIMHTKIKPFSEVNPFTIIVLEFTMIIYS